MLSPKSLLLGGLVFATSVAAVDTAGRTAWWYAIKPLPDQPELTAARIAGRLAGLPAAVERSRLLSAANFAGLTRKEAAAALTIVGRRQLRWYPVDATAWSNFGRAKVLSGDAQGGLEDLQLALRLNPMSPLLHRLAAVVLYSLGRTDEAAGQLTEAIAITPWMGRPTVDLGKERMTEIRVAAARRRLELYPRRRVAGVLELVQVLRSAGRPEEALELLEAQPPHPSITLLLARLELDRGDVTTAMERLRALADGTAYPRRQRAEALSLMALGYELAGDTDAAMQFAQRALDLGSDMPAPYQALGRLAARQGDDDKALNYLRRARALAPTDTGLLIQLAKAADKAGEGAEAGSALRRAIELEPENIGAVALLVDLQVRRGDLTGATLALADALERHPADPRLLRLAEQVRRKVVGPGPTRR